MQASLRGDYRSNAFDQIKYPPQEKTETRRPLERREVSEPFYELVDETKTAAPREHKPTNAHAAEKLSRRLRAR